MLNWKKFLAVVVVCISLMLTTSVTFAGHWEEFMEVTTEDASPHPGSNSDTSGSGHWHDKDTIIITAQSVSNEDGEVGGISVFISADYGLRWIPDGPNDPSPSGWFYYDMFSTERGASAGTVMYTGRVNVRSTGNAWCRMDYPDYWMGVFTDGYCTGVLGAGGAYTYLCAEEGHGWLQHGVKIEQEHCQRYMAVREGYYIGSYGIDWGWKYIEEGAGEASVNVYVDCRATSRTDDLSLLYSPVMYAVGYGYAMAEFNCSFEE